MTSLPGVLTAVAALITAVTGGVGLYVASDDAPDAAPIIITMSGSPAPEETAQVDAGGLDSGVAAQSGDDEVIALADDCSYGDAGACDTLFALLSDECSAGFGVSCDVLYVFSAAGSVYENYAATCGGRFPDWTYAGICSEL
jgi:hypothetical protein